jgi:cytidylate kinase
MPRNIQKILERQLAIWRKQRKLAAEAAGDREAHQERAGGGIAISYAAGTGGQEIADLLAARLDLPHYDHEIVEHIASSAKVHLQTVESLDRHVQGRIDEYIAALFHERSFDRGDYLRLLGRTVVALWEHGPCVLSGHGAVHFVPRQQALTVRLFAPEEARARNLARAQDLDLDRARQELERLDGEQAAFHRRFFGAEVEDPGHYDLLVDTAALAPAEVAALLTRAFRLRFQPGAGVEVA